MNFNFCGSSPFLVDTHRVLHHDVSLNVYCHPVHEAPSNNDTSGTFISGGPLFIKEILGVCDEAGNV
jgi:hypothetical protein